MGLSLKQVYSNTGNGSTMIKWTSFMIGKNDTYEIKVFTCEMLHFAHEKCPFWRHFLHVANFNFHFLHAVLVFSLRTALAPSSLLTQSQSSTFLTESLQSDFLHLSEDILCFQGNILVPCAHFGQKHRHVDVCWINHAGSDCLLLQSGTICS